MHKNYDGKGISKVHKAQGKISLNLIPNIKCENQRYEYEVCKTKFKCNFFK
jgi:hypothetical protein